MQGEKTVKTFKRWIIIALLVTIVTSSFTLSTTQAEYTPLFRATGVVIMLIKTDTTCYLAGQIVAETPLYFRSVVVRGDFSAGVPLAHKDVTLINSVYINAFAGVVHCGAMRRILQSDSVYIDIHFTIPNDTLFYKGRFFVPDSLQQKAGKLYK